MSIQKQKEESDILTLELESQSQQIVNCITKCIDLIREISSFQPVDLRKAIDKNEVTGVAKPRSKAENQSDEVYLYKFLEEKGLVKQVENMCKGKEFSSTSEFQDMMGIISKESHPIEADRKMVVYKIFLPLLNAVESSFKELDGILSLCESSGKELAKNRDHHKNRQRKKKPDAPKGLLSLLQYTDIACLLELTITTSVLPLLERFVLVTVKERAQQLPKSLAGRLHRKCLMWGSDTMLHKIRVEGDVDTRQNKAALKIDGAKRELSDVLHVVSKILLMDRFRPMLLPRHITDLFAIIFQYDRLKSLRRGFKLKTPPCLDCNRNEDSLNHIRNVLLRTEEDGLGMVVDHYMMAKSLQSLLLSGRNCSTWLKLRVSNILTSLATSGVDGMKAIIDVFVVAASSLPTQEISMASARLGQTLCTMSNDGNDLTKILGILVSILEFKDVDISAGNGVVDNTVVATVLTTWAVLENSPASSLSKFTKGIVDCVMSKDDKCSSLRTSIRQIYFLLLFPPTNGKCLNYFCLCLLSGVGNVQTPRTKGAPGVFSVLSQLIRVATSKGDQVLASNIVLEAKSTIDLIVFVSLLHCEFSERISAEDILAISILRSVISNPFDMLGLQYFRDGDTMTIKNTSDIISDDMIFEGIKKRSELVLSELIFSKTIDSVNDASIKSANAERIQSKIDSFQSRFFALQLIIYFEVFVPRKSSLLPFVIRSKIHHFKLPSMLILPQLCEKCSPSTLLIGGSSKSGPILGIISLIISSISVTLTKQTNGEETTCTNPDDVITDISFMEFDSVDMPFEENQSTGSNGTSMTIEADMESLSSTCSIALSILVAILELGTKKRSLKDEKILESMLPFLKILSEVPTFSVVNETVSSLQTTLAEMASHAAVLIQARALEGIPTTKRNKNYTISGKLGDIEGQLHSDQVPMRAFAVSELRKISKPLVVKLKKDRSDSSSPLIMEIDDSSPGTDSKHLANKLLELCFHSLEDEESYVYLAGIQTLVCIVDEFPTYFLPILVQALCNASIVLKEDEEHKVMNLSCNQRVKIVEALNFISRRRGPAINRFASMILNMILFGIDRIGNARGIQDYDTATLIQEQTFHHFRKDSQSTEWNENEALQEEKEIRLLNAGPIFQVEEDDLVRSACVTLLADVICSLDPLSASKYTHVIVDFCVNALKLDHSRLVRRACALLSREMYSLSLQECSSMNINKDLPSEMAFTLSFVGSGEEKLYATLLRSLKAEDVDKVQDDQIISSVSGKLRLYDEVVSARCEEAISFRNSLTEDGYIRIATIYLKEQEQHASNPLNRFLASEMKSEPTTRGLLNF
ncbi:hypothetical protein CTEN210_05108 [Chaetoceros tenuissimus]|uniref:RNA polymerase II assembly factor Rtp1 C-terminal domain-containing protein n=1 Tax=Chaetoceros tenuissimus TaxID=426638 RepID=A0AAD3H2X4_9STRA|nr:hypothetical protein CTEN210_05108 [Chaetoceros tenuissimus]